jgi:hypothetical protein
LSGRFKVSNEASVRVTFEGDASMLSAFPIPWTVPFKSNVIDVSVPRFVSNLANERKSLQLVVCIPVLSAKLIVAAWAVDNEPKAVASDKAMRSFFKLDPLKNNKIAAHMKVCKVRRKNSPQYHARCWVGSRTSLKLVDVHRCPVATAEPQPSLRRYTNANIQCNALTLMHQY